MIKLELPAFETLRYLAEHDPERLEQLRRTLTEQLIARSPEASRHRLRGLQFQIENRVRLAPNPIAACVAISRMMHAALDQLQRAFHNGPEAPRRSARVIALSRREKR